MDWVSGYISGYNAFGEAFGPHVVGDIADQTNVQGIMSRVDVYCGDHPTEGIVRAVSAVIGELLNGG